MIELEAFKFFLSSEKQLKHFTILKYLNILRRFSEEELGGGNLLPPPTDLLSIVKNKIKRLTESGKAITTIRRELQVLNLFYSFYGNTGLKGVESPRFKNTAWLPTLKDADIEKLFESLRLRNEDAYQLYFLVLLTAMKPIEIIKLDQKDFQLDANYIKCGSRFVYLGNIAKDLLKARIKAKKVWNKTLKSYEQHFRTACVEAGVKAHPLLLRNTAAVKMLLAGQDLDFALNNMGVYSDRMRKNLAKALVRYEE